MSHTKGGMGKWFGDCKYCHPDVFTLLKTIKDYLKNNDNILFNLWDWVKYKVFSSKKGKVQVKSQIIGDRVFLNLATSLKSPNLICDVTSIHTSGN